SNISHQGDARNRRGLLHTIKEYYSHTEYQPTREQIEKNRYVFFGLLRCRPWMAIPAGILIQFCYGSVYAWSIFNGPINRLMTSDPNKGGAEVTFYIALGVLGITAAICGPWIETSHPRKSGTIGLVIFFSGHLTSALAVYTHMMSLLYFGYGFVAGIGLGIGYVSTIDAVSKWWPSARGTAAGCAVMGFGGGSLAFSAINKWLIDKTDLPMAFLVLGLVNFALMLVGIQFINPPPPGHNPDGVPMINENEQQQYTQHNNQNSAASDAEQGIEKPGRSPRMLGTLVADQPIMHVSLSEALRSRDYWLLYIAFLANIVFCLVIISNLPRIIDGLFGKGRKDPRDPPLAEYVAVSIEGGFNMIGRVMVGLLSDVLGRKTTFLMLLLTQIVVLIFIPITIRADSFWGFLALIWVATVCYGGGFGMIPAFLADMFGSNNTSSCHGIILTAWSIASVGGGLVFTGVVNHYLSHGSKPYESVMYTVNFMWMLALVIVGFVCCLFVRASIRDRMFPALPNQVIRIRIFGRVLRVL
ncbi:MFS general substrate transporter, partial [Coemansia reversa NRRL 1564]